MSIIRVGTSKKYSEGWESAFAKKGGGKSATKVATIVKANGNKAHAAKAAGAKPKKAAAKKAKK